MRQEIGWVSLVGVIGMMKGAGMRQGIYLKAGLTTIAIAAAFAGNASAATVSTTGELTFTARPGERNQVKVELVEHVTQTEPVPFCRPSSPITYGFPLDCTQKWQPGVVTKRELVVTDSGAPLSAGAGCGQVSANSAACEIATHATISLGDGADSVSSLALAATVDGGDGRDSLSGSRGDDTFLVRDNSQDTVYCGDGSRDTVTADRRDTIGSDCESVTRG
jgi:hypothetical protein